MRSLIAVVALYAALIGLMVASVKIPFLARHDAWLSWGYGLAGGWLLCDGWNDRNKTGPRSAVEKVMAAQARELKRGTRRRWR